MIKKANHLVPGDVVLWNGEPEIVESVSPQYLGVNVKFHSHLVDKYFDNDATFLVSETYRVVLIDNKVEWVVMND